MNDKHYKEKFSAYIDHELPREERQVISEHLLKCEDCRAEHDRVKLGASLAGMLRQADAPADTWSGIEAAMAERSNTSTSLFNFRLLASAAALVLIAVIGLGVYFSMLRPGEQQIAKEVTPPVQPGPLPAQVAAVPSPAPSETSTQPGTVQPVPAIANPPKNLAPSVGPVINNTRIKPVRPPATWNFEAIAGTPKVGDASTDGRLAVGDFLETDGASRARIEVADIGNVEIAPNSRVRLVNTSKKQHRLSLERGVLQAQILAPPRLFIVDTPSAVAVDLGCAYKLEVDDDGNSKLYVTSGYVALERGGLESIVPAGAYCFTRRGQGLGTPFFASATPALGAALMSFDFDSGGAASLATVIAEARAEDTLTLWHLLPRVSKAEREKLFDVISNHISPPDGVTREGVIKLDKKMLEAWRIEMENIWFS